jgi:hypothetical protein
VKIKIAKRGRVRDRQGRPKNILPDRLDGTLGKVNANLSFSVIGVPLQGPSVPSFAENSERSQSSVLAAEDAFQRIAQASALLVRNSEVFIPT